MRTNNIGSHGHKQNWSNMVLQPRAAGDADFVQEDHTWAAGDGPQPQFSLSSGNENNKR